MFARGSYGKLEFGDMRETCVTAIHKDDSGVDCHWELRWRPLVSGVVRDPPRWPLKGPDAGTSIT